MANKISPLEKLQCTKDNQYCGIRGMYVIDHGSWADPEIAYKGKLYNYWMIDEYVRNNYESDEDMESAPKSEIKMYALESIYLADGGEF